MKTRPRYLVATRDPEGRPIWVPVGKAETLEAAGAVRAKLAPKLVTRDGWDLAILDSETEYEPVAA